MTNGYIRFMQLPREKNMLRFRGEHLLIGYCLLFLVVFAWRFAPERLYADSGYYLARVIAQESFHIEHGRWALVLAEVLPWVGCHLGLSMSTLILLHSINNVFWLALCMAFTGLVLRNVPTTVCLAALHLIGLTHGLFCPVFELYYGVDLLVVCYALVMDERLRPSLRWGLAVPCFAVAINSHFFALGLALALFTVIDGAAQRKRSAMGALLVFIAVYTVRFIGLSSYERDRLSMLNGLTDLERLAAFLAPQRLWDLLNYLLLHYADALVLTTVLLLYLLRTQQYRIAGLFVGWMGAFHLFAGLYKFGFYHDRYLEQVHFIMVAWVVVLFCVKLMADIRYRYIGLALLFCSVLYRTGYAGIVSAYYVARTDHIENAIDRAHLAGVGKGIIHSPRYFGTETQIVDLQWSPSVESLLLSSRVDRSRTVSILIREDVEHEDIAQHLDAFIFRRWEIMDTSWLNAAYFGTPQGSYQWLEEE